MPLPQSLPPSPVDFVGNDVAALASHMRHCARAHGRWFYLRSHMQRVRAMAASRIVTMACVTVVLGICLCAVA
jgi:hypothetical protein